MKFKLVGFVIVIVALLGCENIEQAVDKDIDSTKVSQIVKGQTTTDQLMMLLGEPDSKLIIAENNEQWIYKGRFKELDVILINGIVQSYTYKEGF